MNRLIAITIVFFLFAGLFCEERRKPWPIETFTDPASKHYVPHPYPKSNNEIIANLKFQVKRKTEWRREMGRGTIAGNRLLKIVEGKTSYRIGKIVKVKNRKAHKAFDYSWLIFVMDKNDRIAFLMNMAASGVFSGSFSARFPSNDAIQRLLFTRHDILDALSQSIKRDVPLSELKKMERVGFELPLGPMWAPLWEITLQNGDLYYYSVLTDLVYRIKKRIPWKVSLYSMRKSPKKLVGDENDYVTDSVNDEVIVLEAL